MSIKLLSHVAYIVNGSVFGRTLFDFIAHHILSLSEQDGIECDQDKNYAGKYVIFHKTFHIKTFSHHLSLMKRQQAI